MEKESKIVYEHGFFFPIGGQVFGGVLLAIALVNILNFADPVKLCIGVTISIVGLLFFSTKGFEIELKRKRARAYTKVLGLKNGKEISLDSFKFITIINQGYTQSSFTRTNAEVKSSFSTYNLLLVNETHHLKQFVQSFNSYEDALEGAEKLAKQLNFEIVKYDPVRTRGRRK